MKVGVVNTRKRHAHNLTHEKLMSFNMGELIPVGCIETLPADTFEMSTSAFIRTSPLVRPMMHSCRVKIVHMFVPKRLCWANFLDWASGGPDGMNASVPPTITLTNPAVGSLADYLGIPTGTYSMAVSAMPFRAYALCWNNYFRDEDLQTLLGVSTADGVDVTTNTTLQMACWEKDNLTTCRPFEQKGPDLNISIGGSAQVIPNTIARPWFQGNVNSANMNLQADAAGAITQSGGAMIANNVLNWRGGLSSGSAWTGLMADLQTATGIPVSELRRMTAMQAMQELRMRFGSRPTEYLRFLGATPDDARLQLPEFIAESSETIQISEVLQTAPFEGEESSSVVGDLAGHGATGMRGNRFRYTCQEHGYLMTFMVIRPKTVYADGLPRMWSRTVKEQEYQPELVAVGQTEVLNKEVYAAHSAPEGTFGWQDRYFEYRSVESTIHGEFRSIDADWHMARMFSSEPALNADFVKANPTTRVFASTNTDQIQAKIHHRCSARRILPRNVMPHLAL